MSGEILGPDGRPARKVVPRAPAIKNDGSCPHCRAPKAHRMASGGFGKVSVVCGNCGRDLDGGTE